MISSIKHRTTTIVYTDIPGTFPVPLTPYSIVASLADDVWTTTRSSGPVIWRVPIAPSEISNWPKRSSERCCDPAWRTMMTAVQKRCRRFVL